ncbi:response regulator [Haloterrigena salinisoli]|uniref:response regulator n=1 Tax=Haloterrigena salinisoli TaxID=3132747 RepID=UPI0030CB2A4E
MTSSTAIEILLVEDNPGDVRLIEEAFKEIDIEVALQIAMDGVEALEVLAQEEQTGTSAYPELILLDLNLPKKDGYDVLRHIRNDPDLSHLPILVLTSSEDEGDISKSYDLAANAYLTKPTDPAEFISLVQSIERFWIQAVELPPVPS